MTKSVLVYVGLDLVGDGLMKLPFLRALRGAFPAAHVTWLAGKGPSAFAHALAPLSRGLIDEIIEEANIGSHWPELFGRPLAERRFDLVIDTQRRVLTTLILRRIRHRCFVSGTAGFHLSDHRPAGSRAKPAHLGRQLLELLELASGKPADPQAPLPLPETVLAAAERLLPAGPTYIGLVPGAGGRDKCWPLERFLALAERQVEAGRVPVVILGPNESAWVPAVMTALPTARLPLQDAAAQGLDPSPVLTVALGGRLAAAVANDCGGGHMLAAGGTPLVSLFGPTPPAKFAPLATRAAIVTAQQHGGNAMTDIPLATVADALERLLGGG